MQSYKVKVRAEVDVFRPSSIVECLNQTKSTSTLFSPRIPLCMVILILGALLANRHPIPLPTDTAGARISPSSDTASDSLPAATSTTAFTTTTTARERERVLEERLAQLEAPVQQHLYLLSPYAGSEAGAE
ncbi:hypothetical protein K438DRAFT_1970674 [Mycena galopus ATCC 62051]|nr:hypothetical protein K438DRAFT_1970674 [Mycena galopus ATCC 62051]